MAPATERLFFALWPPAEAARQLYALARGCHAGCGGRLMPRDNLHLTLAFLGDTPAERRLAAEAAADGVVGVPFDLSLDRLGYWKHNRILWAGCTQVPEALQALAAELAARLREAGFELEKRPFAAHLTLLRNAAPPAELPAPEGIAWSVDAFVLAASRLGPGGSRYEILRRWPLGGGLV